MHITTLAAASVLGLEPKSLDNILSREAKHLINSGRQGKTRRISMTVLELVSLAIVLQRNLGVPIARGLQLAELLKGNPKNTIPVGHLGALTIDISELRTHLAREVSEILEQTTPPKRGRPRQPQTINGSR